MTDETLPSGWKWAMPTELASSDRNALAIGPFGSSLKVSDYRSSGVPLVFVRNIRSGQFGGPGTQHVSHEKARELGAHKIEPGDILITKMGDPPGDACIYPEGSPTAIITADCIKFRLAPGKGDRRYFAYAFASPAVRAQVTARTKGVAQQKISLETFRTLRLPVAPPAEQWAVVAEIEKQFTRVDAAVRALERLRLQLRRYRTAVLAVACSGGLVPQEADLARADASNYESATALVERLQAGIEADRRRVRENNASSLDGLPVLPTGWAWVTLDRLASKIRNGVATKPDQENGLAILRISAVRPLSVDVNDIRFLSPSGDVQSEYALNEGDLLFTRYNGSYDLVGVCGRVPALDRPLVHPDKLIRVCPLDDTLGRYLELAANAGVSRAFIASRIRTTAGQAGISGADLRATPIPLPPVREQRRIIAEVELRLSQVDAVERAVGAGLQRAQKLKSAILRDAFSGALIAPQVRKRRS